MTFNEDVKNYDRFRPTYTKELFDNIIHYSSLDKTKEALEIGIGTGQATTPILQTGCSLTAIELGDNLASYCENKFREYDNFTIHNTSFEDYHYAPNSVGLIYSGTAFHWIPEEIGYTKVFDMLKRGGTLALFWNRPSIKKDSTIYNEIQLIYKKYSPTYEPPVEDKQDKYNRIMESIRKYGFVDLQFKLIHQTRSFNAEDYISLLNTYSDHRVMPKDIRLAFEEEMRATINKHGGVLTIYDTMDLYLAKKP